MTKIELRDKIDQLRKQFGDNSSRNREIIQQIEMLNRELDQLSVPRSGCGSCGS